MSQITELPIEDLELSQNKSQVARRASFDQDALQELGESILQHGVLQPIVVRNVPGELMEGGREPNRLVVLAGERRYLAAKQAGLYAILSRVVECTDQEALEIQLTENLQRADLHPMQEAEGYQELMQSHGYDADELARKLGKSKSYVYQRIKLLEACPDVRQAYYQGRIGTTVAQLLARIPDDGLQAECLAELTDMYFDGDRPPTAKETREIIEQGYMLLLKSAAFPLNDEKLIATAGSCNACPKRTGNQPELFEDIQGKDLCTDRVCYGEKVREYGRHQAEAARADGRDVIEGKKAKSIVFHGDTVSYQYMRPGDQLVTDEKERTADEIAQGQLEPTLVISPHTGAAIEVYKRRAIENLVRKERGEKPITEEIPTSSTTDFAKMQEKSEREQAFRVALYREVREELPPVTLREVAVAFLEQTDYDEDMLIQEFRGIKPESRLEPDELVASLKDDELGMLFSDCLRARLLTVSWIGDTKTPKELKQWAEDHGINTRSLRAKVNKELKQAKKAQEKASAGEA